MEVLHFEICIFIKRQTSNGISIMKIYILLFFTLTTAFNGEAFNQKNDTEPVGEQFAQGDSVTEPGKSIM